MTPMEKKSALPTNCGWVGTVAIPSIGLQNNLNFP